MLLDTNVLVYSVGGEHPLREPARRLMTAARTEKVAAGTIEAVYLELLYVLSRRRSRVDAAAAVRGFLRILGRPMDVEAADLAASIDLYEQHPRLGSVDALLAAVALRSNVGAFVTADGAFSDVPGLPLVGLGSRELEELTA
jgi:predicted nucleic acid-binding protein